LFEAAPPPKTFVELRGGHGDAFEVDSATYFGSVRRFVEGLRGEGGNGGTTERGDGEAH